MKTRGKFLISVTVAFFVLTFLASPAFAPEPTFYLTDGVDPSDFEAAAGSTNNNVDNFTTGASGCSFGANSLDITITVGGGAAVTDLSAVRIVDGAGPTTLCTVDNPTNSTETCTFPVLAYDPAHVVVDLKESAPVGGTVTAYISGVSHGSCTVNLDDALPSATLTIVAPGVPQLINYQGRLLDSADAPITGSKSILFTMYDAQGTALWSETQSVGIVNGTFKVFLGSVTDLSDAVFEGGLVYLGIKVETDAEMTPRQKVVSVPYAMRAGVADSLYNEPSQVPVGGIVAWAKSLTGVPVLPDGWVECNGQVLNDPDSPLNGTTLPNLNDNRFLKGNATSGGTGGSVSTSSDGPGNTGIESGSVNVTAGIDVNVAAWNHNHTVSNHSHTVDPPYYDVVWIIRVK
jgi:hypothetical protein